MVTDSVTFPSIGTIYRRKCGHDTAWFGGVRIGSFNYDIELTIYTTDNSIPDDIHEELLKIFLADYEIIMTLLLTHLENAFSTTARKVSIDELRHMYYLTAIELKANRKDWWLTLEPLDVSTPYNFFPRFTVVDRKIEWSNVN